MNNRKQIFTTFLALSTVLFLTACGSSKNTASSSDFSSRAPVGNTSINKAIAYCSLGAGTDITMKMKAVLDTNKMPLMEWVYVRLTSVPANFKDDKNYFTMWKWLADSAGNTYLDNTALQFILIDPSNNQPLTGWKSTLRWSDVASIASSMGITDVQKFFDRINILVELKDTKGEYDALKISNYDMSTNKAASQADGLLPVYYVNPLDYATEQGGTPRPGVLQSLHPFANTQYSSEQLVAMSNDFCF